MSCRCHLGCQWKACQCFRADKVCSSKCQCTNCSNRSYQETTILDLPGFLLTPSSSSSSSSLLSDLLRITLGNLILKQWRGFSSHHGWKLFWILRMVIKLSCYFGSSETYNAEMAWFLCQEVVAAYIHQPSHPVCRILLTSFSNRLLCHLFEEGTGIF